MIVDLGPMLRGEVKRIAIDYMLTPQAPEGVTFPEDAHVVGVVTDEGGYMRLSLKASLPYKGECARCLDPVSGVQDFDVERTVVPEGSLTQEQLENGDEEYVVLQKSKLDIDNELRELLLLEFPYRLLCSEDCPGLCSRCGKSLKNGPCGCTEKEIDPRLAVLKNWHPKSED